MNEVTSEICIHPTGGQQLISPKKFDQQFSNSLQSIRKYNPILFDTIFFNPDLKHEGILVNRIQGWRTEFLLLIGFIFAVKPFNIQQNCLNLEKYIMFSNKLCGS